MNELMRRMLFLPPQASQYARDIDALHYFIIITTILGAAGVFLTAIYFFVRYRRRSDTDVTPFVTPRLLHEALFIGVPLTLFLVWFGIGYPQYLRLSTPPADAMDVFVQGKKWMWKFAYPGGPNAIDSLRVPANRPVRLLITSRDVIHSFFVPALRIKMDALPGRYTQTWFAADRPGRYEIFCAEYCGLGHSSMLGELVVMPAADFDAWIQQQRSGLAGAQDAAPMPGERIRPSSSLVEEGRRVATGKQVVVDEAYLTRSMMDPGAEIVAGYQNVMPTYQGKLTPPEVAAVVEFIKSLRTPAVRTGPSEGPAYESVPRK